MPHEEQALIEKSETTQYFFSTKNLKQHPKASAYFITMGLIGAAVGVGIAFGLTKKEVAIFVGAIVGFIVGLMMAGWGLMAKERCCPSPSS